MKKKSILLTLVVVMVVTSVAIGATLAYFSDQETATNTFTVGNVDIELDEPAWVEDSKLIPGTEIAKDPTVTVVKGSEKSYVRIFVEINNKAVLDELFDPDGADLLAIFDGYDEDTWLYKGVERDAAADTITYEFWYAAAVDAAGADIELEPLFTSILVPSFLDGDDLALLEDFEITIVAQAIQTASFADADAAWDAWA